MSNIYITEPQTKGKVILRTTFGDLDLELWPKEAPKACRNFIQLCLEGHYDNTIFHRIVKGFIAQGGDPTGTGFGGESIYGSQGFPDEFHTRIRFSHRGMVAMAAIEGKNGSQFFITLDKCPEIQGKHTIFGKITGDTIFNILKLNDFEVDENERPLFPPKILNVDVVWNPFDDIIPRESKKRKLDVEAAAKPQKAQKQYNLLSFGDEAEEEQQDLESQSITMKSSYHFSEDPLERQTAEEIEKKKKEPDHPKLSAEVHSPNILTPLKEERKRVVHEELKKAATGQAKKGDDDFATRMRSKNVRSLKRHHTEDDDDDDDEQQEEVPEQDSRLQAIIEEQKRLKREIISMKNGEERSSDAVSSSKASLVDEQRAKYLQHRASKGRLPDEKVLGKLEAFKQSLKAPVSTVTKQTDHAEDEDEEQHEADADDLNEGNDMTWKATVLKFGKESKVKDPMARKDDVYTTFDPLKLANVPSISSHQRKLLAQKKLDKW